MFEAGCCSGYVPPFPSYSTRLLTFPSQLAVISQGIAARYARRQASSEQAYIHASMFPVIGKLAKVVLEDEGITISQQQKAKL